MCGRFTLTIHQLGSVIEAVGAFVAPEVLATHTPRFNVAPSNDHVLLRHQGGRREVVRASWGLINHWSADPSVAFKQINARAETLSVRPAYRDAFARRRCLLPADGFYEWRGPRGQRQPIWFHRPDRAVMWFAGLYESWSHPETGEQKRTFTVITTSPNSLVAEVHDRMPAIISPGEFDRWLHGPKPSGVLKAAPPDALRASPASLRVNSAANDDPGLLDPDDPLVAKQLTLF